MCVMIVAMVGAAYYDGQPGVTAKLNFDRFVEMENKAEKEEMAKEEAERKREIETAIARQKAGGFYVPRKYKHEESGEWAGQFLANVTPQTKSNK